VRGYRSVAMRSVLRTNGPPVPVVRAGSWSARVTTWRDDDRVAHLVPLGLSKPARADLEDVIDQLSTNGFEQVVTAALAPADRTPYSELGFTELEHLHLLECRLDDIAPKGAITIKRPRRADWPAIVDIDHRAFEGFWRLDAVGIDDAMSATPVSRLRVATIERARGHVLGYAVTGRSGRRGYVQRLAVDPAHEGKGIGGELLRDGLRWLQARGATTAMVNTQLANHRALALYERNGFRRADHDLAVLSLRLRPS
jgi:ribosomal protein S18 acetylase RimI-like enzyme